MKQEHRDKQLIRAELRLIGVAIALLGTAGLASAAYKWVDENGVTHFTQHPPPKAPAEYVRPPPPPATSPDAARKALEQQQQAAEERDAERRERHKQAAEAAAEAQWRSENCARARANLTKLQQHPRFRAMDAEGNVTVWTEERRQEEIHKAAGQVDEYCR